MRREVNLNANMIKRKYLLSTVVVGFLSLAAAASEPSLVPANGQGITAPDLEKFFAAPTAEALEIQKILYLLGRVRQSPYFFMEGGNVKSGEEAFLYFRSQYARLMPRIPTAEKFIEKIASEIPDRDRYPYYIRSQKAFYPLEDRYYYLKTGDEEFYPLQDVLYDELYRLEGVLYVKSRVGRRVLR